MNTDELVGYAMFQALLVPLLLSIIGLLILYCIIRVAVARGLRDHQLWMERNRPTITPPPGF